MMNILIIKLGAIGDVIRTTSILHGLKSKYKNCKIGWVTKSESFDVLNNNKLIDEIYLIDNKLNKKYDLVISLDDDFEACKLASKINPKKIIGAFSIGNKITYTNDSSLWFDMGLISKLGKQKADELKANNRKTYQSIMYRILGLKYKKKEPIIILDNQSLDFSKKFTLKNNIKKSDLVIGINTGAGGRWEDKKLSIEKTAELIDKLNNQIKDVKILLFGGPEETDRNKEIRNLAITKIIDAGCNNSIMEFASLVNLCKVLVASDSLALHVSIALKKKVVCFFGPTSYTEIELYGRGIKVLPKIGCLCCYKPKCDVSPVYEVDEIVNAVKKLI